MKERDEENGQILAARLEDLLKEFRGDILTGVDERLSSIQHGLGRTTESNDIIEDGLNISNESNFNAVPFYVDGNYCSKRGLRSRARSVEFRRWKLCVYFRLTRVFFYYGPT